jgi:ribonuclease T2
MTRARAQKSRLARLVIALVLARPVASSSPVESASSCPAVGTKTHFGCDDGVRATRRAFDMWELARAWTPGFCASAPRACEKGECARSAAEPALTLHGLWPSYSTATKSDGRDGCYWPQNCVKPSWYPSSEKWTYAAREIPSGAAAERIAPAWTRDGLGAHEWAKHGTCASWIDVEGTTRGMTQREFYNVTFALAEALGTPEVLLEATGSELSLADAQQAFGGASKVALGCTKSCVLLQVVQCFKRTPDGGVGEAEDCPCVGVRDSRYDNSCAERCERVRVLSPEQTGCHADIASRVASAR